MRTAAMLLVALVLELSAAQAEPAKTTPASPNSPQPTLPSSASPRKPGSPVVEQIIKEEQAPLVIRKGAARAAPLLRHRRLVARRGTRFDRVRVLDRPTLAGVELVKPLAPPGEPPHVIVPVPAFPLESFATAYTTPPPPIFCHHTRRDPYAPDPHLYREVPVACEPDNP